MNSFQHLKAKLEHAQEIGSDIVRCDIEELASVLTELGELKKLIVVETILKEYKGESNEK